MAFANFCFLFSICVVCNFFCFWLISYWMHSCGLPFDVIYKRHFSSPSEKNVNSFSIKMSLTISISSTKIFFSRYLSCYPTLLPEFWYFFDNFHIFTYLKSDIVITIPELPNDKVCKLGQYLLWKVNKITRSEIMTMGWIVYLANLTQKTTTCV